MSYQIDAIDGQVGISINVVSQHIEGVLRVCCIRVLQHCEGIVERLQHGNVDRDTQIVNFVSRNNNGLKKQQNFSIRIRSTGQSASISNQSRYILTT